MEEARKAAFEQINKKAILVNLVRRQISNLPFDVKSTNKIAELMNVQSSEMIQFRKFLFNPQRLSNIRSLINDACLLVWNQTRPWDNVGFRLLPIQYYDDFVERFDAIKIEFEEAVNKFIADYDDAIAEAKKDLGKVFDKNDYPDKAQIKDLFVLTFETAEFPDIDDIRLNLSGPELVEMQKEITDRYSGAIKDTMTELCDLVEKRAVLDTESERLIKIIDSLNLDADVGFSAKLAEIKDRINYKERDETPESMMVMDDLDDLNELDEDERALMGPEDLDNLI
jgi:hypothetical protein